MSQHTGSSIAKTAMFFGAAGFLAGIFYAPKSGKESREELAVKTAELKRYLAATKAQIKDIAQQRAEEVKSAASKVAKRTGKGTTPASDEMTKLIQESRGDNQDIADSAR